MNKYVDVHPQCMGAYPPLGCESSPPPSKKIIVISNPLLRKYGFLRTEYNMIQKMLGLDVFSFYEIMIRHEWIQEFWLGECELTWRCGGLPPGNFEISYALR